MKTVERYVTKALIIALCLVLGKLRSGTAGLKYRLLAHYLLGSGKQVDLGYLPDFQDTVWEENCLYEITETVELENQWLAAGFHWSIAHDDYACCFGGYFVKDGQCRDLYDWHPWKPGGDPNIQEVNLPGKLGFLSGILTSYLNWLSDMTEDDIAHECYAPGEVSIWDGLWLALGGRPFISTWEITEDPLLHVVIDEFEEFEEFDGDLED